MINLFLGGFQKKRGEVGGERERERVKKIRKHASRCLVTGKFFFFFFTLNEPDAVEPAYLLRERGNSFFDRASC